MTFSTLTPTQRAILEHAIQNNGGKIIWLPENLRGGASAKVIEALYKRSLIEPKGSDWVVHPQGYAALGIAQPEPAAEPGPQAAADSAAEPASEPAVESPVVVPAKPKSRSNSKQVLVIGLLQRPEGATIAQIMEATGWQSHTVRGLFSGALKKKLGMNLVSDKAQGAERVYRLA